MSLSVYVTLPLDTLSVFVPLPKSNIPEPVWEPKPTRLYVPVFRVPPRMLTVAPPAFSVSGPPATSSSREAPLV